LGYTPEELIGKFPSEFVHPDDFEILQNSIFGFVTEIEDLPIRVRLRNIENNYFWFEIKGILIKENGIPINFQSSTWDVTLRKNAEEIVENTLIQERELNELRTNLISTISHEFRTPMTTIRTSAELIAMYLESLNFENSVKVSKRINIITEEIDRIVELMDAVLTISKDDAGKTSFNPVQFDLKQACIDVTTNCFSDELDKRKVQMSFEGEFFPVFADINLMKYCLFNLLNNAFKYSKGVILKLFINENKIVVEVIDFGLGIPEEDQTKLFNTFFRASNTSGIQGTGLGLYIVKTFTERNLGTVKLQSELGKGTKVTLQFSSLI
jgi:signal transduction histidine kinase